MMKYRIWRTPGSAFGNSFYLNDDLKAETIHAEKAYTDTILADIAAAGFNGIWVHGQLQNLMHDEVFTEFGARAELHLECMRKLIDRAARHGLKVFLYMQVPRAVEMSNKEFWKHHADVLGEIDAMWIGGGSTEEECGALCTSTEKVQSYIKRAMAGLTRELFGLGGYIFITASEFHSHCWARRGNTMDAAGRIVYKECKCPRCGKRKPQEVVVELIKLLRDGIRAESADTAIVCWNWSWSFYVPMPCREIIDNLPPDVEVMADFERGGYKNILGHERHFIDEYSISYAGPSEQFRGVREAAANANMGMMAKLQLGTTHELGDVVNMPLLGNIYRKADYIRKNKIDGFMGCWNFGNNLSSNTAGFNYFISRACPDDEKTALESFAGQYFPGCDPVKVRMAWQKFAEAMDFYPFDIPFLYMGPSNFALSLIPRPAPLTGKTIGRSWLLDERGDTMDCCFGAFSRAESKEGIAQLIPLWESGVDLLRAALSGVDTREANDEYGNAEVCLACWKSVWNLFRFSELRENWSDLKLPLYLKLAAAEAANLERVLPFVARDPRQGYHIEAHGYFFNAEMLREKIAVLHKQLGK